MRPTRSDALLSNKVEKVFGHLRGFTGALLLASRSTCERLILISAEAGGLRQGSVSNALASIPIEMFCFLGSCTTRLIAAAQVAAFDATNDDIAASPLADRPRVLQSHHHGDVSNFLVLTCSDWLRFTRTACLSIRSRSVLNHDAPLKRMHCPDRKALAGVALQVRLSMPSQCDLGHANSLIISPKETSLRSATSKEKVRTAACWRAEWWTDTS